LYKGEWLDLVFKNRNQQYGAYELRQHYGNVMAKAMAATFLFVACASAAITIIAHSHPVIPADPVYHVTPVDISKRIFIAQPPKPRTQAKPKQQATQHVQSQPVSTTDYREMKVVDDAHAVDPKPIDPNLAIGSEDKIVHGSPTEVITIPGDGTAGGKGTGTGETDNTPMVAPQVMPEPFGGAAAWAKFLQKNLHYPGQAQDQGVSGRVFVSFIVERDGHLSNFIIERKGGYGFDEEALRVLKLAPAWKPGIQNGQAVRVKYVIPINFQLAE